MRNGLFPADPDLKSEESGEEEQCGGRGLDRVGRSSEVRAEGQILRSWVEIDLTPLCTATAGR